MKTLIVLTVILTNLCLGERQQRSTVLTDESKRVLEHFDFSNFDKQEALNNIERQRYENQIRGKRSQSSFGKDSNDYDDHISEVIETDQEYLEEKNDHPKQEESSIDYETVMQTKSLQSEHPSDISSHQETPEVTVREVRSRVGRRSKKKHKLKSTRFADDEKNKDEMKMLRKKRRKKKGKKRKRRYWDEWTQWSPCSVTCGRGRKIRWRKCIAKNCNIGELEMGEKTCQLPACNLLTKILGL